MKIKTTVSCHCMLYEDLVLKTDSSYFRVRWDSLACTGIVKWVRCHGRIQQLLKDEYNCT